MRSGMAADFSASAMLPLPTEQREKDRGHSVVSERIRKNSKKKQLKKDTLPLTAETELKNDRRERDNAPKFGLKSDGAKSNCWPIVKQPSVY
jgi:hypothetical protein